MTVCDFKVIGILGLINHGALDYKIIALEVEEANERGIQCLKSFKKQESKALEELIGWFYNHSEARGGCKLMWGGEVKDSEYAMYVINEEN